MPPPSPALGVISRELFSRCCGPNFFARRFPIRALGAVRVERSNLQGRFAMGQDNQFARHSSQVTLHFPIIRANVKTRSPALPFCSDYLGGRGHYRVAINSFRV